jgi:hypothetical protein
MENYSDQNFQKYSPEGDDDLYRLYCPYRPKMQCWYCPTPYSACEYTVYFCKPVWLPESYKYCKGPGCPYWHDQDNWQDLEYQELWPWNDVWQDCREPYSPCPWYMSEETDGLPAAVKNRMALAQAGNALKSLHEAVRADLRESGPDIESGSNDYLAALSRLDSSELLNLVELVDSLWVSLVLVIIGGQDFRDRA